VLFGLGWPQWLTIIALVGALILTFKLMARASIAYERARQARERQQTSDEVGDTGEDS
jgi:hypothetical protein